MGRLDSVLRALQTPPSSQTSPHHPRHPPPSSQTSSQTSLHHPRHPPIIPDILPHHPRHPPHSYQTFPNHPRHPPIIPDIPPPSSHFHFIMLEALKKYYWPRLRNTAVALDGRKKRDQRTNEPTNKAFLGVGNQIKFCPISI